MLNFTWHSVRAIMLCCVCRVQLAMYRPTRRHIVEAIRARFHCPSFTFCWCAIFRIVCWTYAGCAHIAFLAFLLLKSEIKWYCRKTSDNHSDSGSLCVFYFSARIYIYCPLWTKQLPHTFLLLHSFEYNFKFSRTMGIGLVLANNILCWTQRKKN